MKNNILIIKRKFNLFYSSPVRMIVFSFLFVILVGALLLSLPISSKDGLSTSFVDSFFTSTSATCIVGLTLFDTCTKWTTFGQLVILLLIQIGGIGLITITIFFYVLGGKKLGLRGMHLARESATIIGSVNLARIFKFIIITTLSVELMGAIILSFVFIGECGFLKGIYTAIFLSISAFCNAGIDIFGFEGLGASFLSYNNNPLVIHTIVILVLIGDLGLIVWYDLIYNKARGKNLLIHTKVVLIMTIILNIFGFLIFIILEYNNPSTLQNMSLGEKINASIFQSLILRTAGFDFINFLDMRQLTKIITTMIMFIGGAPGSTSGGIKVTTFAILCMTVVGVITNKPDTIILGHKVSKSIVYKALSIFFMSILIISIGSVLVYYSVKSDAVVNITNSVIETISAFSTAGITTGVTTSTGIWGRIFISAIMFVGRVGPISFLLSLSMKVKNESNKIFPDAKIMVY